MSDEESDATIRYFMEEGDGKGPPTLPLLPLLRQHQHGAEGEKEGESQQGGPPVEVRSPPPPPPPPAAGHANSARLV